MQSFGELNQEQAKRESDLLSILMGETGMQKMAQFEAELTEHRGEMLFKITTEMEDTQNALSQVDQLALRLRKHLERLEALHKVLSK